MAATVRADSDVDDASAVHVKVGKTTFERQSSAVHAILANMATMGRLGQPGTRMFTALLLDKRGDTQ